jgi:hypothetical protein
LDENFYKQEKIDDDEKKKLLTRRRDKCEGWGKERQLPEAAAKP